MSKPPLKGASGPSAQTPPNSSTTRHTRSATAALAADKLTIQKSPSSMASKKGSGVATSPQSPLRMIADTLTYIVSQGKMDVTVKQHIEDVIKYAKKAEIDGGESNKGSTEQITVSGIRDAIKVDLAEIYNALANQLNGVHGTVKAMHTSVNQAVKLTEEAKTDAKELASKIGKVTDVTDKIVSDTTTY
jgi:hypothetical protein